MMDWVATAVGYLPKTLRLGFFIAILAGLAGYALRAHDLADLNDTLASKADTATVQAIRSELHGLRDAVDSMSARQTQYYCDNKPKWCR